MENIEIKTNFTIGELTLMWAAVALMGTTPMRADIKAKVFGVMGKLNGLLPQLELPNEEPEGTASYYIFADQLYWLANQGDGSYIIYDPEDILDEVGEHYDPDPLHAFENWADTVEWFNELKMQ